jgi:hypothetical protein
MIDFPGRIIQRQSGHSNPMNNVFLYTLLTTLYLVIHFCRPFTIECRSTILLFTKIVSIL